MTRLGGKIKEWFRERRGKLKVKTWVLLVMLLPLLFIDATLLRNNHIRMTELRDAVLSADTEEDDERLATALVELKEFVFSNIVINIVEENGVQRITFGTGPFYLEHQYLRDATLALEKAEQEAASDRNPNGNIYGKAGEVCRPLAIQNGWAWNNVNFINCMMTEIQKYPASDNFEGNNMAILPSTELYRRNYASPVWAPTVTGFFLALTLVIIVVILIRMVVWIVLRIALLFL
ncbi:MAG: hypothetical protein Q4A79_00270 [Candidatus Saccharibacteria bacterium]|nr:hypothetical protein [Candidatus Saccharibacteria bacterium]